MSDKAPSTRPVMYHALLPKLIFTARGLGYCLAIHGSMQRDLDIVAIPWTEDAVTPIDLWRALMTAVNGVDSWGRYAETCMYNKALPHNRVSLPIHLTNLGGDGPYIDLSIMRTKADIEQGDDRPAKPPETPPT